MRPHISREIQDRCFLALDSYARGTHGSYLDEFFLSITGSGFIACFRPLVVSIEPAKRYLSEYLYFESEELLAIGTSTVLHRDICRKLDRALSRLVQE